MVTTEEYQSDSANLISKLPIDILRHILLEQVDPEELLFVRLVCKQWSNLKSRNRIKISTKAVISHYAAYGTLSSLKLIRQFINDNSFFFIFQLFKHAQPQILDWALQERPTDSYIFNNAVVFALAYNGDIERLKIFAPSLPDAKTLSYYAVKGGQQGTLQWAKDVGYGWDEYTCKYAAKKGNLKLLQWLKDNGCDWDYETCESAAENGHFEVLKWARQHNCPYSYYTARNAAKSGNLEMLQWLEADNCHFDSSVLEAAAEAGHFEILKWAIDNRCIKSTYTMRSAALCGRLDIVEYLYNIGCEWRSDSCAMAAKNGHFEVLKFLRSKGCPWDENTMKEAVKAENMEIFLWTIEKRCPKYPKIVQVAARSGFLEMLLYMKETGHIWRNEEQPLIFAAIGGQLKTIVWLLENGCKWDKIVCQIAVREEHLDILQWANKNKLITLGEIFAYATKGKEKVLDWLRKNNFTWDP